MRINKGRGWDNLGGTGEPMELPPDVRMPTRARYRADYTGEVIKRADSLNCIIDREQHDLGGGRLGLDGSRHVGLRHYVTSHPHAYRDPGADDTYMLHDIYVADPRARFGVRQTDLENIHRPDDPECPANQPVEQGMRPRFCNNHVRMTV